MTLNEALLVMQLCDGLPVHKLKEVKKLWPTSVGAIILVDKKNNFGKLENCGSKESPMPCMNKDTDLWLYESFGTERGQWKAKWACDCASPRPGESEGGR